MTDGVRLHQTPLGASVYCAVELCWAREKMKVHPVILVSLDVLKGDVKG
jgi:hypothetical protein